MIVVANSHKNRVTLWCHGYLTQFQFKTGNERMMIKFAKIVTENIREILNTRLAEFDTLNKLDVVVTIENVSVTLPCNQVITFLTKSTDSAIKLAYALETPCILMYVDKITRLQENASSLSGL